MPYKLLLTIFIIVSPIYAKLLHRELVSAPEQQVEVCFTQNNTSQDLVDALLPTVKFNLNLSGLIRVVNRAETSDCRNTISLLENTSIIGTHSIEVQFHGPEIGKLPTYKMPLPNLSDKLAVNRYANKITRAIHEYITHHRGWHDRKIAFVQTVSIDGKNHYSLKISNIDGSEDKTLFTSNYPLLNPVFSPNSEKIAITELTEQGTNVFIRSKNSDWEKISEQADIVLASSWSPNSRFLLMVNYLVSNPAIISYDSLSGKTQQVMPGWSLDCDPIWPQDDYLYLTSSRSGSPQIYRYQLGKKLLERITYQGEGNEAPSISRDGSVMTYLARVADEYQLMVHHFNQGKKSQKICGSLFLQDPRISEDGSWILFSERQGRRNVIGLIDTAGQTHIRLIAQDGQFNFPTWVPESWPT
tara:strand:- start:9136 stop:10377 length:1242 start_codon:yes stop_codon:yes gene_type:complete